VREERDASRTYDLYIDGAWTKSASGEYFDDRAQVGHVPEDAEGVPVLRTPAG
jgi:hypothetical protein